MYFSTSSSLRQIQYILKCFFYVSVSHVSIYKWVIHFSTFFQSVSNYFLSRANLFSDDWHADETFLKVKAVEHYLWILLDSETRTIISFNLSDTRDENACKKIFIKARQLTAVKPNSIITDGLATYKVVINTLYKECTHKAYKDKAKKAENNIIESFNNTFKSWYRTKRGFKTFKSAEKLIGTYIFFYNFIREHTGISKLAPAEVAGNIYTKKQKANWFLF